MVDDLTERIHEIGRAARAAARVLSTTATESKNAALLAMAGQLLARSSEILAANAKDLEAGRINGLSEAMLDRLRLDEKRLTSMAEGIRTAASLPDPVGRVLKEWGNENGLTFRKISVPIGVIGIIYESRPNVTSDAAVLCLKAGNVCILRGGSEAIHSNMAIAGALQAGIALAGLPEACIQLIPVTDREVVRMLRRRLCGLHRSGCGSDDGPRHHPKRQVSASRRLQCGRNPAAASGYCLLLLCGWRECPAGARCGTAL